MQASVQVDNWVVADTGGSATCRQLSCLCHFRHAGLRAVSDRGPTGVDMAANRHVRTFGDYRVDYPFLYVGC